MDQLTDRAPSKQRFNNLKEDKKGRKGGRKFEEELGKLASVTSPQRLLLVMCLHKSACGAEPSSSLLLPTPVCPRGFSGRLPGPQRPMNTGRTPVLWQYSPPGSRCRQNHLVLLCRNPVEARVDTQLDTQCGHSPSPGSQREAEVGASPKRCLSLTHTRRPVGRH